MYEVRTDFSDGMKMYRKGQVLEFPDPTARSLVEKGLIGVYTAPEAKPEEHKIVEPSENKTDDSHRKPNRTRKRRKQSDQ